MKRIVIISRRLLNLHCSKRNDKPHALFFMFLNISRYMGVNCDIDIDDCAKKPCANGGTCIDLVGKFVCSCPPGTSGYLCDINHNDCYEGACFNGGVCTDRVNGFHCRCPDGFTGPRCEGDVNECLSNPCNPNGSLGCVQLVNAYTCNCKPAYTGVYSLVSCFLLTW